MIQVAEKETKKEGRFSRLFGAKDRKNESEDFINVFDIEKKINDSIQSPNSSAQTDESAELTEEDVSYVPETENEDDLPNLRKIFGKEKKEEDKDNVQSSEESISEVNVNTDNIERDAKEYYNNNHSRLIDEKINKIHEHAAQSYAKEDDDNDESTSLPEAEQSENDDRQVSEMAAPQEEEPVNCGETKSYDMSQLINILKNRDADKNEEDEDEYSSERSQSKKSNNYSDDDLLTQHDSELYDDVNEYYHDYEYTEKTQSGAIFKSLRKAALFSSLGMLLTFVATLLCIWIELGHAAGLPFATYMHPGRFGRIYAMVSLQMLALCVFFNLDGLLRGIRKLSFKRRTAPEASAVLVTAICIIHTCVSAVTAYESTSYRTYCFVGCFVLFILSVNTFIKSYTNFRAITLILSKKPKLTTKKLDMLSEEYNIFSKYLGDESEALEVAKTDFVSDFIKNTHTVPRATSSCNVLMYSLLILSAATTLVCSLFINMPIYDSFTAGVSVFLFSSPASMLLATALPYFTASSRASKTYTAILGEAAGDAYINTGVISFDDTEVFSPKAVKVTSIKTYNDHRIDKVIVCMAKIFDKVGGPLSHVFSSSVQDIPQNDDEIMILETASDGLHLKVGTDDVLVGTGGYLRMYDIEAPADSMDETEMRSLTSIIFLVCNNELAAKFYVRYSINKKFESVLSDLYNAGVCCGVKTLDPGIDNQLIEGNLKGTDYPISVIRKDSKKVGKIEEKLSGSIVSLSTIHNFLKTFIAVDRLNALYKSNIVLATISALIGLVISACLTFTGVLLSPVMILLFQLLWLIPCVAISIFGK